MATLKDIAAAAGVSITVVSDVLNQKSRTRRVAQGTSDKVLAVAARLGYAPNLHARALVLQRTYLVGLVAASIHSSFYGGIIAGFLERAESAGLRVMLSYTQRSSERAAAACAEMVRRGAEGVAFLEALPAFRRPPPVPLAATHQLRARRRLAAVAVDHAQGAALAVGHLLQLGRRRIALVGGDIDDRLVTAQRLLGEAGAEAVRCRPDELPQRVRAGVDGAFAATDFAAIEALGEMLGAGLAVPRDCALVGYDDLQVAAVVRPALSSISQPKEAYGRALADLLLEQLAGRPARAVLLAPELVVRSSSLPTG